MPFRNSVQQRNKIEDKQCQSINLYNYKLFKTLQLLAMDLFPILYILSKQWFMFL